MSDVGRAAARQTTVGPAPANPSPGPGTGSGGGSASTLVVANPSADLSNLSVGQILEATVQEASPNGNVRLATEIALLALRLAPVPPKGSLVRLQVAATEPQLALKLLGDFAPAGPQARVVGTRSAAHQQPPLQLGDIVSAHFVAKSHVAFGPDAPLFSVSSPAEAYAANALTTGTTATTPLLPNAGPVTVRVQAIVQAGAAFPALARTGPKTVIGTVTEAVGRSGATISSPVGTFNLSRALTLPAGTQIVLEVTPTPRPSPLTSAATPGSIVRVTQAWEGLRAVLQQVRADATTGPLIAHAMPQSGPRLATGLAFFLAALLGNRLQDWLGRDAMRLLQNRQPELLSQLVEGFGQLSRAATEPMQGDWRLMFLPFLGKPDELRLFLRRRADDEGTAGNSNRHGTRFILEAELSRLGLLQFDGLVRDRRFDLVIRSPTELPQTMREDLRAIFNQGGTAAAFHGQLDFQPMPVTPTKMSGEPAVQAVGVLA